MPHINKIFILMSLFAADLRANTCVEKLSTLLRKDDKFSPAYLEPLLVNRTTSGHQKLVKEVIENAGKSSMPSESLKRQINELSEQDLPGFIVEVIRAIENSLIRTHSVEQHIINTIALDTDQASRAYRFISAAIDLHVAEERMKKDNREKKGNRQVWLQYYGVNRVDFSYYAKKLTDLIYYAKSTWEIDAGVRMMAEAARKAHYNCTPGLQYRHFLLFASYFSKSNKRRVSSGTLTDALYLIHRMSDIPAAKKLLKAIAKGTGKDFGLGYLDENIFMRDLRIRAEVYVGKKPEDIQYLYGTSERTQEALSQLAKNIKNPEIRDSVIDLFYGGSTGYSNGSDLPDLIARFNTHCWLRVRFTTEGGDLIITVHPVIYSGDPFRPDSRLSLDYELYKQFLSMEEFDETPEMKDLFSGKSNFKVKKVEDLIMLAFFLSSPTLMPFFQSSLNPLSLGG